MYAVMMPFFGMGGDHRADSWSGEPGTGDTENVIGVDGTVIESDKFNYFESSFL